MSRLFWTLFARPYAAKPVSDDAAYRRKLDLTARYLRPDMRLLEVGCGTGSTALHHAPSVARIDAVDYAQAMVDIARSKARAAGIANVTFAKARLDEVVPPPEGPWDMALALSVLHLLPDPEAGLDRLRALVRPGGHVVSSTVCIGEMGRRGRPSPAPCGADRADPARGPADPGRGGRDACQAGPRGRRGLPAGERAGDLRHRPGALIPASVSRHRPS